MGESKITSDNMFSEHRWFSRNTACSVLDDMRQCCATMNFGPMPALIEELQMMFNRMERKLDQVKQWEQMEVFLKERRNELDNLRKTFSEVRDLLERKEHGCPE